VSECALLFYAIMSSCATHVCVCACVCVCVCVYVCVCVCVCVGLMCEVYHHMDTPVSLQFFGVDISEAMTSRARARECYDQVVHSEVSE
jgi:hypothetical protein